MLNFEKPINQKTLRTNPYIIIQIQLKEKHREREKY